MSNDGSLAAVGDDSVSARARALIWVAVPCVLVLLMYWSTAADLVSLWASTQDYGHGYLVAPLAVFLVWRRRQAIAREPLAPCLWAGVLTAGASIVWGLAALVGLQVIMQLALLGVLLMIMWTVLGWPRFRWVAFPIAYVIFAIPVWSITVPIMQGWTADVATQGVRWLGIPVFREGPFLTIPGGRFEIAEVCAGLRFLMASMSLVALYGYLNFDQPMRRIAFFVLGVVWAVFFNWVRVVVVIWLGHTLGVDAAIVEDHNSVGWVLFAGSLVPLFIIGHYMQPVYDAQSNDATEGSTPSEGTARGGDSVLASDPGDDGARVSSGASIVEASGAAIGPRRSILSGPRLGVVIITAALSAAVGPVAYAYFTQPGADGDWLPEVRMPQTLGGWTKVAVQFDWQPVFAEVDRAQLSTYERDGQQVGLYVGQFTSQRQGKELISDTNSLFGKDYWSEVKREVVHWQIDEPAASIPVMNVLLKGQRGEPRNAEFVYIVGGKPVTAGPLAKVYELVGRFAGRTDAGIVAIAAASPDELSGARMLAINAVQRLLISPTTPP